jgi:hypothetical protein
VIVGSNSAIDGRSPLRFAHRDARSLADVLISSGGFATRDVKVLLDATPAEVLAALDAARTALAAQREEGLLVFYYSGHASQRALFPGGKELPLEQLRSRLSDEAAGVRIGIIDACRGGGWTQAKGLSPAAPFEVGLPALSSEGTALLAASSGLEDAHEAELLQGSFFTHYLVAGLRGAADSTGDGQVTLSEAFAYANRLTIRDTASTAKIPQHPSFDLRLRGRQDVVLTSMTNATTQLVLAQTTGPLEVVQLSTGLTVVEAAPGEQVLRLTLPAGSYLVRRVTGGEVRSKEVQVRPNEATRLEESSLTLVGTTVSAGKGPGSPVLDGQHELSVGLGVAPLDPFVFGVTTSLDYSYFFTHLFGWRVVQGAYNFNVTTGLSTELDRNFGVLPTEFSVIRGALHTAAIFAPRAISGPNGTELRLGFTLGAGAMVTDLSRSPNALKVLPAAASSLELTWMLRPVGPGGLGVRLSVSEVMGFSATVRPVHLATLNLTLVGTAGSAR